MQTFFSKAFQKISNENMWICCCYWCILKKFKSKFCLVRILKIPTINLSCEKWQQINSDRFNKFLSDTNKATVRVGTKRPKTIVIGRFVHTPNYQPTKQAKYIHHILEIERLYDKMYWYIDTLINVQRLRDFQEIKDRGIKRERGVGERMIFK